MVQASCFIDVPIGTHPCFPAESWMTAEEQLIVRHLGRWWDGHKPAYQTVEDIESVISQSDERPFALFFQGHYVRRTGENAWDIQKLDDTTSLRVTTPELLGWLDAQRTF